VIGTGLQFVMAAVVAGLGTEQLLRVVMALRLTVRPRRWYKLQRAAAQRRFDTAIVLENVANPRNAAAIHRVCEAYGVGTVHMVHSLEMASCGAAEAEDGPASSSPDAGVSRWLDFRAFEDARDCVASLRGDGFRVLASSLGPGAQPLGEALFGILGEAGGHGRPPPSVSVRTDAAPADLPPAADGSTAALPLAPPTPGIALVMGNEQRGTSGRMLKAAGEAFFLPQRGLVQSLNVSVASAVALHATTEAIDARARGPADGRLRADAEAALEERVVAGAPRGMAQPLDGSAVSDAVERVRAFELIHPGPDRPEVWPEFEALDQACSLRALADERRLLLTDTRRLAVLATWLLRGMPRGLAPTGVMADESVREVLERV